ncbi:flagellar filament capping protein FliD, partial [Candidatus Poribacteria bacterium]|nr:flagellar filament capping protein FliD [Candidatus Poribacteria bacterium]
SNTDRLSIQVNDNATGAQGTVSLTLGIAEQMDGLLERLTDSIDGMLAIKQDALQGQHDAIQDRIDRIEARLLLFEERLRRQFLAMEQAMSRIQSQGNFLLAQLGAGFGIN